MTPDVAYSSGMTTLRTRFGRPMLLAAAAAGLCACGGGPDANRAPPKPQGGDANSVNLYIWSDYLAPDTLANFERQTGIKVHVAYFETNEVLESHILTGSSGYDVVVPTAPFFERQIRSGAYLVLDRRELPNLANMDPYIMAQVAQNDPQNAHGVVYTWGSYGIGYNEKMVAAALPGVPLDSWRLIFDPAYAARLAGCGIGMLDAPAGVVRLVLAYLGKDPNAPSTADLEQVQAVLTRIRPYIRSIDTTNIINAMANGDICMALGYNGDFVMAGKRAREAKNGISVNYLIPREGSLLWFDMLGIPRDAPHPANAHRLINYLMDPEVIAKVTDFVAYANGNAAASALIDPALLANPIVYPTDETRRRLFVQKQDSPEQARAMTRLWQKFKTGQ
ncbi:MAG: polyamine ABC transporter substrate-binding protein [Steroidobacterales bacterium]